MTWPIYIYNLYILLPFLSLHRCSPYSFQCRFVRCLLDFYLTHWGRDKMAAILQTTLSNTCSWMKMLDQATSHYLNQWWLDYRRIYASLGLSELSEFYMEIRVVCMLYNALVIMLHAVRCLIWIIYPMMFNVIPVCSQTFSFNKLFYPIQAHLLLIWF